MKSILLFILVFTICSSEVIAASSCDPDSSRSALVIIDMQPYFRTRTGQHQTAENIRKFDTVLEDQRVAIRNAKAANIPIILVKYAIPEEKSPTVIKTADGGERINYRGSDFYDVIDVLKREIAGYGNGHILEKNTDGMFDKYEKFQNKSLDDLNRILDQNDIGTLIVAGANGGACVKASIEGALHNRCRVVAISSGIADFNYPEFIYPYRGHYEGIGGTHCPRCRFEEVQTVAEARAFMIGPANRQAPTPNRSTPGVGTK